MDELLREYLPILIFLAIAIGLGLVLILAAAVVAVRNPDPEKVSAYECGFNAFDEFNKRVNESFRSFNQRLASEIVESFRNAETSDAGIDFVDQGFVGPSSTWTYMINDNPLGDVFDRLNSGIKRMLGRS